MFLLVPAHPGFPGQIPHAVKWLCCVCVASWWYRRQRCYRIWGNFRLITSWKTPHTWSVIKQAGSSMIA